MLYYSIFSLACLIRINDAEHAQEEKELQLNFKAFDILRGPIPNEIIGFWDFVVPYDYKKCHISQLEVNCSNPGISEIVS